MYQFTFNGKTTWDDYGLSLDPGYIIPEATPITKYVHIPETSVTLDLSEALSGMMNYSNRIGFKASFTLTGSRFNCEAKRTLLASDLHGKEVRIVSPHETTHYYKGRLSVGALTFEKSTGHIEISGQLDPYRYKNELTYVNVSSTTTEQTIVLNNEQMPTTVKMATTAQINIKHGTTSVSLSAGTHTLPFALVEGENELKVQGTAEVIFEYQEGAL